MMIVYLHSEMSRDGVPFPSPSSAPELVMDTEETKNLSLGIMLFGTVYCQLFPDSLIALFSSNPETIQAGGMALRIYGFLLYRKSSRTF